MGKVNSSSAQHVRGRLVGQNEGGATSVVTVGTREVLLKREGASQGKAGCCSYAENQSRQVMLKSREDL